MNYNLDVEALYIKIVKMYGRLIRNWRGESPLFSPMNRKKGGILITFQQAYPKKKVLVTPCSRLSVFLILTTDFDMFFLKNSKLINYKITAMSVKSFELRRKTKRLCIVKILTHKPQKLDVFTRNAVFALKSDRTSVQTCVFSKSGDRLDFVIFGFRNENRVTKDRLLDKFNIQ